jgi:Cytochrome b5-like Heme/Steroid binding domain
MRGDFDPF